MFSSNELMAFMSNVSWCQKDEQISLERSLRSEYLTLTFVFAGVYVADVELACDFEMELPNVVPNDRIRLPGDSSER